ncbi:hypothetical protein PG993_013689 [Apiospora rasikravindrae]|uniref:Heterokaryon incompatibility domain-containing protein n=1 Tax=Apiospora rasikravindrae TaxID=990691 RepID=A0ABR1RR08_9PEZI
MGDIRVIDTSTFELHQERHSIIRDARYAILSHRWQDEEVTLPQLPSHARVLRSSHGPMPDQPHLEKIRGACQEARNQGYKWLWIDSCCIDKSSSEETKESLNSRFKWYHDASMCITYLADVQHDLTRTDIEDAIFNTPQCQPSEWFSRGWTLQELLASNQLGFYDKHWTRIGTRADSAAVLGRITGIGVTYLTEAEDFQKASVAQIMSWMAGRSTTKEEDLAYSMLGIFEVTMDRGDNSFIMDPLYGRGRDAFIRLQKYLLAWKVDESIFAWRMPQYATKTVDGRLDDDRDWQEGEWGLLCPHPSWFKGSGNISHQRGRQGFSSTPEGVQMPFGRHPPMDHHIQTR